ncbi:RraA family protein [Amylibacter sp. SFDW26]|uniref:RraA family protein n=1 Tax=Amylibacter sp. SFDW26 TaxID=2652722 RepID=UPI0012628636|nr:RraA family protein [Amylibacter sp. SFDW26]KAB7613814.1 RraA family protein [Amylibacter sp. SFDW26]
MTILQHTTDYPKLPADTLAVFADIPAAVISDAVGERMTMGGAINPLTRDMRICGQARTADCLPGDNSPIRVALQIAKEGEVIVADAKAYEERAVLGGLIALFAMEQKVGGLVIDGSVRDSDEIIEAGLNVFCRSVVPCRPKRQNEGAIDAEITCGGAKVKSGDLIIGDADGVVVVPLARVDEVLEAAQAILAKEAKLMDNLQKGGTLAEYMGTIEVQKV